MSLKINEINRAATISWCPISEYSNYVVTGSVAGSLEPDFSSDSKLELWEVNLNSKQANSFPAIKSYDRFNRISWGNPNQEQFNLGIIAGAMVDGTIGLWNPLSIKQEFFFYFKV